MLCQPCNLSLGAMGDDPLRIAQLLAYALKWKRDTA